MQDADAVRRLIIEARNKAEGLFYSSDKAMEEFAAMLPPEEHDFLVNELAEMIPRRLADTWLEPLAELAGKTMPEQSDRELSRLASRLHQWELKPQATEGYRKAEVTAGGVDTRELNSQSMQSRRAPGLYFIGEVVDVTGWLGGYNFQWAWASAAACAGALSRN